MITNTKTLLTVKIDKKLKAQAEKIASEFGLPLGTMVNSLIRRTVNEGRLELIAVKPAALQRINKVRKDMREGKGHGPFTADEMFKELER